MVNRFIQYSLNHKRLDRLLSYFEWYRKLIIKEAWKILNEEILNEDSD